MAEQEMLLDTDTIRAAVAGEKWAKEKVIEHYTPSIGIVSNRQTAPHDSRSALGKCAVQ